MTKKVPKVLDAKRREAINIGTCECGSLIVLVVALLVSLAAIGLRGQTLTMASSPFSDPVCTTIGVGDSTIQALWDHVQSPQLLPTDEGPKQWTRTSYVARWISPDSMVTDQPTTAAESTLQTSKDGQWCVSVMVTGTIEGSGSVLPDPVSPTSFYIQPPTASTPIALVGAPITGSVAGTRTLTLTKTLSPGTRSVLLVSSYYTSSQYTLNVTDDHKQPWARDVADRRALGQFEVWSVPVTASGPVQVSVTGTANTYIHALLAEFSGLAAFDRYVAGNALAGTTAYTTDGTGTIAGSSLLIGFVHDYQPTNVVQPAAPFAILGTRGDAFHWTAFQFAIVSAGAHQMSGTVTMPFKSEGASVMAVYR